MQKISAKVVVFGGVFFVLLGSLVAWQFLGATRSRMRDNPSPSHSEALHGLANVASPRGAPRFELPDSQGKIHQLEELAGNWVIVHFWATWCPPCIEEFPQWLEFTQKWKDRPLRFLAISLDTSWAEAHKILPDGRVPSNVIALLDAEKILPDLFGTYQYPETYLLNPKLEIVTKWVGPQDWAGPEIGEAMERALGMGAGGT